MFFWFLRDTMESYPHLPWDPRECHWNLDQLVLVPTAPWSLVGPPSKTHVGKRQEAMLDLGVFRCREKGHIIHKWNWNLCSKNNKTHLDILHLKWLNKRNPYHKLSIQDTFTRSTLVEHSFSSFPCCMSSTCRGIGGLWYHIETNRKAKLHQES